MWSHSEIITPITLPDGTTEIVGIESNDEKVVISVRVVEGNVLGLQPSSSKTVTMDAKQLKWLAPRLNEIRKRLGIKDGYEG